MVLSLNHLHPRPGSQVLSLHNSPQGTPNATVVSKAVLRTKALGEDWDPQAVVVWGAFQHLYLQGDIKKMSKLPQIPVYLGSVCFCQLQEDPNGESLI